MKTLGVLFLSLIVCTQSLACLRLYHQSEPEVLETLPIFHRSIDKAYAKAFIESIDWSYQESASFEQLSDAAVYMIHLNRYDEAFDLLSHLYKNHPEEYNIVSNLATLSEITGRINSAYRMFEKAITLHPNPEKSYDWVHLAVLRAKKLIRYEPSWLNDKLILNLDLHNKTQLSYQELVSVKDTIQQIEQYIQSTLPLISTPDLFVSNIMYELGLIQLKHISIQNAFIAFKISAYYDEKVNKVRDMCISKINQKFAYFESKYKDFERPLLKDYFPPKQVRPNNLGNIKPEEELIRSQMTQKAKELSTFNRKRKQTSYFAMRVFTIFFGFIMLLFYLMNRSS